ncbi:hypothetical protein CHS0354_035210 [Potamilus streckersoni]|uniref:Biotin carboxylase n=1 Tax=Potamilus streckersoni TaxID=2493646 RepID=A0AAE0VPE1_9BIVA|nr:hypothetical protein CHS0354_035210 [Potamilus streckersoni]
MYNKILIANRGEIAIRIIRACKELGIATVAVHSTADANSMHVKMADESICIGGPRSTDSYLKVPSIIAAAEVTGAEAIHPGYGFLSERADFVEKCVDSKIDFIGPSAASIIAMGDKISGRKMAAESGVPVSPGTGGIKSDKEAYEAAKKIGFPVIIKATAGGGGKGMRIVYSEGSLINMYELARSEALSAFGNGEVYIEKFIENPRHIEVQILGDKDGNVIHLGERDCSIQRKNQKIIEEAPAPNISEKLRNDIREAAVKLAKKINYYSAGTMEFLMDKNENFYFMEMNSRVQVEHPVTEMITGVDIVKEQIRISSGSKLSIRQEDVKFNGHAIECRINAEDPETFAPSPDCVLSPYYDSMIGKLICHGRDRDESIRRMIRCLDEYIIEGVKTSIPLQMRILMSLRFQEARLNTGFIKHFIND